MNAGWKCPECGTVWAPSIDRCTECGPSRKAAEEAVPAGFMKVEQVPVGNRLFRNGKQIWP